MWFTYLKELFIKFLKYLKIDDDMKRAVEMMMII